MSAHWEYLTHEDVRAIHSYLIATFGGLDGLRDEGLYPSAAEKAARYAYGIVNNHPFADGNKRTGGACIGMFLRLNDIKFKPRHDELLRTVYGVADGTLGYEELVAWIEKQF